MSSNVETLVRSLADGLVNEVAERVAAQLVAQAKTAGKKEWLTPDEAAEYLSQARITLEIQRCKGIGPKFTKIGRNAVRYRRSDLEAYLLKGLRQSTSEPLPPKKQKRRAHGK